MKSPNMETSRIEGFTDAHTQESPITIDSTTDAPGLDKEPTPEFNDNITEFISHLANEEDKDKMRSFMRSDDKRENDGSPEYYRWIPKQSYQVSTLTDSVPAGWRRYTRWCLIKSQKANG
jgi:hypothetical protein